jgi:predicted metalloprotease with PDZ domain
MIKKENSEFWKFIGRATLAAKLAGLLFSQSLLADVPRVPMQITLDASEISRQLVHSTMTFETAADTLTLVYPKWIPGAHDPCGPIKNVAGFRVYSRSGDTLDWERNYTDPFRFMVPEARGHGPIRVELDFIASVPFHCNGLPTMGLINWNAVAVYPENLKIRELRVEPRLILPEGWKFASALPYQQKAGDTLIFDMVTFEELVDMPVLCGRYLRSYEIEWNGSVKHYIHAATDQELLLEYADSAFASGWGRLIEEADEIFGRQHFEDYHFLVSISDSTGTYGLEHRNCSVNSGKINMLTNYGKSAYFFPYVMPHEYVHAWCGKYLRPAGMNTPDFQTAKDMELLWVYEGLTEYLGTLLSVRSGLVPAEYNNDDLAAYWGNLRHTAGRDWRSLKDVAVSTQTVWGGPDSWGFHRRGADYYAEGALLWLEVDSRIREATADQENLDTFCREFFGTGDPDAHSLSYEKEDIVDLLTDLVDFNWDSLFTVRLEGLSGDLDPSGLAQAGYRFGYTSEKPEALSHSETRHKTRYFYESLGFAVSIENGSLQQIVPGSPADEAGVYTGQKIIGVNGKTYTIERLEQAIEDTRRSGQVELLLQHGELLDSYTIEYSDGPRYFILEPIEGRTQWLDEILKPVTSDE